MLKGASSFASVEVYTLLLTSFDACRWLVVMAITNTWLRCDCHNVLFFCFLFANKAFVRGDVHNVMRINLFSKSIYYICEQKSETGGVRWHDFVLLPFLGMLM